MSIASAITAAQGRVADCYTAISTKGGTLPATQNLANMPTAINSIPSGDSFIGIKREVVSGVYQLPTSSFSFSLPNGTTDVGQFGLYLAFQNSTGITSADLSSLEAVSGQYGLAFAFAYCPNFINVDVSSLKDITGSKGASGCFRETALTSLSFDSLETISGSSAASDIVRQCTSLSSISFPKLKAISGGSTFYTGCYGCTALTTISFPKLDIISGTHSFYYCFSVCTNLESIYFNALTTTFGSGQVFDGLMSGTGNTKTHTIHFPSNLQSTISGLSGYPNFGGISGYVVLAFDLPATS